MKAQDLLVKGAGLDYYHCNHYDLCNALGYYVIDDRFVKVLEFNPNSTQQLQAYIRHQGYEMPLHFETGKPTTGKEGLEDLVRRYDDPVLKLAQKSKKISKLRGTYASGAWIPGEDGRVHGEFRFSSAVGQIGGANPNTMQYPEHYDPDDEWITEIMTMVKSSIKAEEGHTFVKVDMRGFHGRMQGFLAEDTDYYRLSAIDLHSYNTAYYLDLPDKDELISLADDKLVYRLNEIKQAHKHERNAFVKRVSFLNQYGGGADKAGQILRVSPVLVQEFLDTVANRFPKTFKDFPKWVRAQLHGLPRIITPFGCLRYFWDRDILQATAFPVSNCAHSHIQLAMIRLFEGGAFERYGACNFCHDSLWYHCPTSLVQECVAATKVEFEKPSEILKNSLGAFWCAADAQLGLDMYNMEDA